VAGRRGGPVLVPLVAFVYQRTDGNALFMAEEAKALPLLLRHSPGTILPNRIYVVSAEAAQKLRAAGVQFTALSRESATPSLEGVGSGERKVTLD
jgi:hypothetical protein